MPPGLPVSSLSRAEVRIGLHENHPDAQGAHLAGWLLSAASAPGSGSGDRAQGALELLIGRSALADAAHCAGYTATVSLESRKELGVLEVCLGEV